MARIRMLISEPRIRAIHRMATECDRVEFCRALPDGRVRSGMATPEDILGLIDIIDQQRRRLALSGRDVGRTRSATETSDLILRTRAK